MTRQFQLKAKAISETSPTGSARWLKQRSSDSEALSVTGTTELNVERDSSSQREPEVPVTVHEVLRSPGQPLDPQTRAFMEPRFGHDFGNVRVHTDRLATRAAGAVGALAFTVSEDLVFGSSQFAPDTQVGKRLIAHELTHVVQQSRGARSADPTLWLSSPADRFEAEADRVADVVMATSEKGGPGVGRGVGSFPISFRPPGLQRKAKFVKTTPKEDINPAADIGENKIPEAELFLGQTNFLLNGISFTGASDQTMRGALKTPTIAHASTTINAGSKSVKGEECWFDSVPDNEGSYEMKVLKSGSWTKVTEKKNVGGRFPTVKPCQKGTGDVTFVVKGEPKDDNLRNKVKAHEKQHATDDETVFNDLLGAWDKAITKAHKKNYKAKGPNLKICEKAVYVFDGKNHSPDDLVANLAQGIVARATEFHGTEKGKHRDSKVESFDSDCNVVTVRTE